MTRTVLLLALAPPGCGPERAAPAPAPAPASVLEGNLSPADLYAGCEALVEGPQADAECTTDAGCARGGCGNVVCTTAAGAADVMTTCEDRPCFAALDTCGCHDGRCTWTLRAEAAPNP